MSGRTKGGSEKETLPGVSCGICMGGYEGEVLVEAD